MPNNNPGGENGAGAFDHFGGADSAYGAVKKLQSAQSAIPIGSAPGVTAGKQATRQSQRPPQAAATVRPTAPLDLTPQAWHTQTWAEIASDPDASDLVKQFASKA